MKQLDSFKRYLLIEKRYSKHTVEAYTNDIQQFVTFLSDSHNNSLDSFEAIVFSDCRAWVVSLLSQQIAPRSIHRKVSSIRKLFKFLLAREEITVDPTRRLQLPKFTTDLPEDLKAEDFISCFNTYFKAEEESLFKRQDALMLAVLISTGLRVSELCELSSSSVRLSNEQAEIKVLGKGKKERILPISRNLFDAIKEFSNLKNQSGFGENSSLFISKQGKPMYPRYLHRLVVKVLTPLWKLKHKGPHALRHAFATNLLNSGAELIVIRSLLGHANLAATQVYTNASIDRLKEVYKQSFPKA